MQLSSGPAALEETSLGRLYQRHWLALYTAIRQQISSGEDAEDILLDVFLAAHITASLTELVHARGSGTRCRCAGGKRLLCAHEQTPARQEDHRGIRDADGHTDASAPLSLPANLSSSFLWALPGASNPGDPAERQGARQANATLIAGYADRTGVTLWFHVDLNPNVTLDGSASSPQQADGPGTFSLGAGGCSFGDPNGPPDCLEFFALQHVPAGLLVLDLEIQENASAASQDQVPVIAVFRVSLPAHQGR